MFRRVVVWFLKRFSPLWWKQENFHHGRQLLAVWRWGRMHWEVWDWGPNTGSHDVYTALRGLSHRQAYARLETLARRRLATPHFREAKALV